MPDVGMEWGKLNIKISMCWWVAFPSPNGKSWNPHTVGKLTL